MMEFLSKRFIKYIVWLFFLQNFHPQETWEREVFCKLHVGVEFEERGWDGGGNLLKVGWERDVKQQ